MAVETRIMDEQKTRVVLRPYQSSVDAIFAPAEQQQGDLLPKAERTLTNKKRRALKKANRQIDTVDVSALVQEQIIPGRSGVSIDGNQDLRQLAVNNGMDLDGKKPIIGGRPELQQKLDNGGVVIFDLYGTAATAPSYRQEAAAVRKEGAKK